MLQTSFNETFCKYANNVLNFAIYDTFFLQDDDYRSIFIPVKRIADYAQIEAMLKNHSNNEAHPMDLSINKNTIDSGREPQMITQLLATKMNDSQSISGKLIINC